ncbi:hypothetical protein ACFPRL_32895 [Pseudoclavibacter helvolus]
MWSSSQLMAGCRQPMKRQWMSRACKNARIAGTACRSRRLAPPR